VKEPDPSALILAQGLIRFRRFLAPSGSLRERLLRLVYLPVLRRIQRRRFAAGTPEPKVMRVADLRAKTMAWPARPKILVLKLDHLGDFVVALPAFRQLRQAFPHAEITVLCASWNRVWAERSRLFDAVVTFDFFAPTKGGPGGATSERRARFARLDLGRFDLAIDLRHDPDTRPLLALVDAGLRAGFCAPPNLGGDTLDLALPDMEHVSPSGGTGLPVHAELRLFLLIAAVTATFVPPPHPARDLAVPGPRGPGSRPYAILAPGAGSPIRIWPIERLAAVGRALADRYGLDIMLIGAAAQTADCAAIARLLPEGRVRDFSGQLPTRELPEFIRHARILVGMDTGTSHLAAALDVATVAIMGGIAAPETWRVNGVRAISIASQIACARCYLTYAAECPFDVRCMTAITVEHVLTACETLLGPPAYSTGIEHRATAPPGNGQSQITGQA
jgi:ADP-heptose:LPS heptosyltransferase